MLFLFFTYVHMSSGSWDIISNKKILYIFSENIATVKGVDNSGPIFGYISGYFGYISSVFELMMLQKNYKIWNIYIGKYNYFLFFFLGYMVFLWINTQRSTLANSESVLRVGDWKCCRVDWSKTGAAGDFLNRCGIGNGETVSRMCVRVSDFECSKT